MDIGDLREKIDEIDDKLVRLFCERMSVSADIAAYKAANGLPVLDAQREQAKLADVLSKTEPDIREYMSELYALIFRLSRAYQERADRG